MHDALHDALPRRPPSIRSTSTIFHATSYMSYEDGMPAGGTSRFRGYSSRMSERQQLALLLQMSSQEMISGAAGSSDESVTAGPDNPCSPAERGGATAPPPSSDQEQQQIYQQHSSNAQCQQQQQQRAAGSVAAVASHVAESSGAPCEMRRTPPQNKVDRSGTGQSGSSPRVTLRLNQVRGTRDEKKGTGASNSRQGGISAQGQASMETSSKTSSNASSASTNAASNTGTSGNTSSSDSGDVYEFKSSKEPTPVRGASTSPNPNPDKDKDGGGKPSAGQGNQAGGGNTAATGGGSSTSTGEATTAPVTTDEVSAATASPSSKRTFEGGDNTEEQDDENRRKKRKDTETAKENTKNNTTGRQNASRSVASSGEKCTKSGKQGSGTTSGKGNQNAVSVSADRKSPSTSSMASSPKPSSTPGSTNTKTATPAPLESDGEEDRLKCSDSNSAPKVPPLKIVIPQSTTSEQEQGNRNGKNITNRSHQLPYVVASSNSNDSLEKDQSQSTSGTTSPTEGGTAGTKGEDKKDFSAILHGEERSTHHQRVLRSSHRTGNGNNGSTAQKESTPSSGNGSYSNSSPLPANASMDRSNNSSPLQRHHSPTPETAGSDSGKTGSAESASTGTASKSGATAEKSDKGMDTTGKNQKDSNADTMDSVSSVASSAISNTNTPAPPVELHPRKRKMKPSKEAQQAAATANEAAEATSTGPEIHPHDQPITNCYQLFLNIRKQIERRRKGLFPVQPKPPQGFKDYLMNRCTYVLAGNVKHEPNINPPVGLHAAMKDLYVEQEKERYRLRMQHVVEKEKLVLSVEQEILRVHGRAARALANQSLPFSVCTILKDEEVYNVITPEQEEKDRNARSRYNGRLFLSWLQDVDDKWEKIKEGMLLRHHNEADSLHAVQRMHWEWKLKEVGLCESKVTPQIEDVHVPMVHVSDDFDLLPA